MASCKPPNGNIKVISDKKKPFLPKAKPGKKQLSQSGLALPAMGNSNKSSLAKPFANKKKGNLGGLNGPGKLGSARSNLHPQRPGKPQPTLHNLDLSLEHKSNIRPGSLAKPRLSHDNDSLDLDSDEYNADVGHSKKNKNKNNNHGHNAALFIIAFLLLIGGATFIYNRDKLAIADQPIQTITEPLTEMEFVWVPPGCFQMGSDNVHDSDEKPIHEVCLSKGFWLGKVEVTQGQWQTIMGSNPAEFDKGDNYPVEMISWEDANAFIKKLNAHGANKFDFPTEAQWEYACKSAGLNEVYCGSDYLENVGWYANNAATGTMPVATKQPNRLGLYDMSGNVAEWVRDWYWKYPSGKVRDPIGLGAAGQFRVYRGGSWTSKRWFCRTTFRFNDFATRHNSNIGMRLLWQNAEAPVIGKKIAPVTDDIQE